MGSGWSGWRPNTKKAAGGIPAASCLSGERQGRGRRVGYLWLARTKVAAVHEVAGMITCEVAKAPAAAAAGVFVTFVDPEVGADMTMASMEPEDPGSGQVDFWRPGDPLGHKGSPGTVRIVTAAGRENGASRILPAPGSGRVFGATAMVRLGDAAPSGRLRLDGVARMLQDVATDDDADRGELGAGAWVVRRTLLEQRMPARLDDAVALTTWCTGLGSRWAERTTALRTTAGARIDTATLWVHLDPASGRPARLPDAFVALYTESTEGREVTARQELEPVALDAASVSVDDWWPRFADLDVLDHVNNAVTWSVIEQVCDRVASTSGAALLDGAARVEVEFRDPVDAAVVRAGVPLRLAHRAITDGIELALWSHDGATAHVAARVVRLV